MCIRDRDGQIDNRRKLMRALERACSLNGVEFEEGSEVEDLTFEKNKITGATVLCATGEIKKLTAKKQLYAAVRGVKKFLIRFQSFL